AARGKLGPGGPGAWLNLRLYDTTGRIFDGTNAHSFFDHRIERGDRQWFFPIGRPTSDAIVEVGMKSDEGFFVKIARSARVEFPRHEPAAAGDPEWLTVRVATGHVEHSGSRMPARPGRISTGTSSPFGGGTAPVDAVAVAAGLRRMPWEDALHFAEVQGADRQEWEEVHAQVHPDGTVEESRRFRWDGPMTITSWEAGPFSHPVEVPEPVREGFSGKTRVFRLGGRTHVVYGPWQVVIRGIAAQQSRAVLSRWEVYRTWAEVTGHEVEEFGISFGTTPGGASERMVGASGRRWIGGSEVRLGGSSELFFLKASEIRLGGASERLFVGSSETVMRGASERMYAGSSGRLLGRDFLGASEGRLRGQADAVRDASSDDVYPAPPAPPAPPLSPLPPSSRRGS
ncbi:MAG: DUF4912 domain-containing protein, partial [Deltaproteobacteria bacterium]|nr:DUF4912 domain-containing protein [Deltaproteobacteria bacterium]